MVTLSRKFSITAIPNSSKLLQRYPQSTTTTHIFIPFSQLQQRKLFESHLISVLHGCTHLTQIKQVHAHILRKGLDQCCYVLTKLIRMLTKIDVPVHSYPRLVFHQVKYPNPFLWTALIRGYATQGPFSESVVLYNRMRSEGTGPVSFTFSALFKACVAVLDVGLGRQVHAQTILIGYAQNGRPREALDCFWRMQDSGVKTDEVTIVGVISACALLGVAKYANWVHDVAERYGFGPTENVVVGSALIDMYSKCGSVEEAYNIFEGMKERNVFSYSSMIVGFAMHGRVHEAMQLFHEMLKTEIRPNKVTFIGVLTACSHAGLVDQGRQLFATMDKCFGVAPSADHYACMVDLLGDMNHPQSSEIKRALADLLDKLKAKGYQPNLGSVTYDLSDDEKKRILMNHSEKLALAYGLLSSDAGCTIKIMKNLRICEDCHAFMCSASQVMGREIVVRDNMRFHHFSDGACSCGNFW
ncbi:pentatricopeptide repeat-containing protein [Quercus suber]|uniref:Pentatricopeptide repeat-containing protein n=1 Tax=Quercus suber TaxID=58331 RepID=A0AAW0LBI8_QUESU